MAYSVTLEGNKVAEVREIPDTDYDELGLEWALSELKDTWRYSKNVSATFSLADDNELRDFLRAVTALLGPDALGEHAHRVANP